ncbi:MAG: DedA family protein [Eisenbergiella sp.]
MQDIVIKIMNEYGYLGIIFLIFIENIFPPIPSEVILTFGGFLTTCTVMNVPGVVVFATVGSVMGAFLLYYLGYFLSPSRQEQLINGKQENSCT